MRQLLDSRSYHPPLHRLLPNQNHAKKDHSLVMDIVNNDLAATEIVRMIVSVLLKCVLQQQIH